jgi:hypothetical protein
MLLLVVLKRFSKPGFDAREDARHEKTAPLRARCDILG